MMKIKKIAAFAAASVLAMENVYVHADSIDPLKVKSSDGFRYVVENDEIVLTGYSNTREPEQVIPEKIDGMPVTRINALWGNVTELVIPSSVKVIDSKAFKGNTWLTSVVIPESVTRMGENVLEGCTKLEKCELMADISELPSGTFFGCQSLSELSYSDKIESLGAGAFSGCEKITEIDIPDGMTEIPGGLFNGCSSLKKAELPDGLTSIGNSAFKNCSSVTQITIPDGVEYIGEYAFAGCSSVTEFIIPDNVEIINNGLFSDCTSLESVKMPEFAQSYSENTTAVFCDSLFKNCSSLREVIMPYGIRDIGEKCFDGCTSLEHIYLPETVKYIDNYAFRNCASLTEIELPGYSVIYGHETFAGCSSLKELFVPETVYSFGGGGSSTKTFKDCSSLKSLYLPSAASASYPDCFDGCDSLEEIYIGFERGSFMTGHFGYNYDENADKYIKNDKLKIFCREDSDALKYAQENEFDYEIIDGVLANLVYFSTYDDPENEQELEITELNIDEHTFINGEGEFRNSQRIGLMDDGTTFKGLQNTLVLGVSLGFDAETYPYIDAEPSYLNFDGIDLTEIYDEILYDTEALEDGNWYLIIKCTAKEGNNVTAKGIKGGKMNTGFFINSIGEPQTEVISGDINGDGTVNAGDIMQLKKYLLNISGTEIIPENSDLNSDGKINVIDFITLKLMMMV